MPVTFEKQNMLNAETENKKNMRQKITKNINDVVYRSIRNDMEYMNENEIKNCKNAELRFRLKQARSKTMYTYDQIHEIENVLLLKKLVNLIER